MQPPQIMLLALCAVVFIGVGAIVTFGNNYNLNRIKSKRVGDGQHGTARFATSVEIKQTYKQVVYRPGLWRRGVSLPTEQGIILGTRGKGATLTALVDTGDVHTLMIGASGIGKTAFFMFPNIEFACASGMSFISTDTKGDLYRKTAAVARDCYGYNISVIDLRNPTRSDEYNMLYLVNKYIDLYKESGSLSDRAKAEKFAKITAKTIINAEADGGHGANAYFYDAAEGLLTSVILLIAEFAEKDTRHISSVFKLVQELVAPSPVKGAPNKFQQLINLLPEDHKARWFAGAALYSSDQAVASVLSTVMSKLIAFIDSEIEQLLCFGTTIDMEKFCNEKSATYLVLPEEDCSKHFLVSLLLQQFYREMLIIADEHGGRLPNKVMIYADELGTLPKIESLEMIFSASRSRNISIVAIIQSLAQLQKTYGDAGAEIIVDNTQDTIFGGFAPGSKTAEALSKSLGSQTIMSGSVSKGRGDPSQQLQMIERPLMTSDELKAMPKGEFIVMKTGMNPMQTKLPLFTKWGIRFEEEYRLHERDACKIKIVDQIGVRQEIQHRSICNK